MKKLIIFVACVVGAMLILPLSSFSGQFDAPYYAFEKRHKDAWAKQDKQIN